MSGTGNWTRTRSPIPVLAGPDVDKFIDRNQHSTVQSQTTGCGNPSSCFGTQLCETFWCNFFTIGRLTYSFTTWSSLVNSALFLPVCRPASTRCRWSMKAESTTFLSFQAKAANSSSANITFRQCTTWFSTTVNTLCFTTTTTFPWCSDALSIYPADHIIHHEYTVHGLYWFMSCVPLKTNRQAHSRNFVKYQTISRFFYR